MAPVAAAVLPHPPLLVPELAGAAAPELDPLRAACRRALSEVLAAAKLLVVVGDGPVWGVPEPSAPGSFRPYGADLEVTLPALTDLELPGLPAPARLPDLPLSLAVAAHLLTGLDRPQPPGQPRPEDPDQPPGQRRRGGLDGRAGPSPHASSRLSAVSVPGSLGPGAAAAIGRAIAAGTAERGDRVGLVVMGDLSGCRTEQGPGAFRDEAAGFDASVSEALRTGKPARLLDLDPALAADLLVAGRVPLQVLAGALQDEPAVRGQVLYEDAPYGVGYLVALLSTP